MSDDLTDRERHCLSMFSEHRMDAGDVAILCDERRILEIAGLADHWDQLLRDNMALTLTQGGVQRAVIAVARPARDLRPGDHVLWAELREELLGKVQLAPLVAIPAA